MNITPLEIRQKEFEKNFRGFDKDEVKAFLNSLSIEWEKLNDLNKELKFKLEAAHEEVKKLREVENSLFKTLKTAEDTGANMIEQATRTAELHMRETEMKADALMSEAKSRAKSIIEDAEDRAGQIVEDMEDEIRQLEQVFRSLDANKASLMGDLKMLAEDILSKLGRHEDFPADIKPHIKKAKELAREVNENNGPVDVNKIIAHNEKKEAEASIDEMVEDTDDEDSIAMVEDIEETPQATETKEVKPEQPKPEEPNSEKPKKQEQVMEGVSENKEKGSFFDQFD